MFFVVQARLTQWPNSEHFRYSFLEFLDTSIQIPTDLIKPTPKSKFLTFKLIRAPLSF